MKKSTNDKIKKEFLNCILRTIDRIRDAKGTNRPFHTRLLSREILRASLFERSFSTSFGQRVIEKISNILAADVDKTTEVENQKIINIKMAQETINSIDKHLQSLRENRMKKPNWNSDFKSIKRSTENLVSIRIINDLWFVRNGVEYFFSIKTVKPNIDQTEKAKKDILTLKVFNNKYCPFFALPYNPYGENKNDYNHTPPFAIFDMINDNVVLIGREYWDMLGGTGTYQKILQIADEVGLETKEHLKKLKQ